MPANVALQYLRMGGEGERARGGGVYSRQYTQCSFLVMQNKHAFSFLFLSCISDHPQSHPTPPIHPLPIPASRTHLMQVPPHPVEVGLSRKTHEELVVGAIRQQPPDTLHHRRRHHHDHRCLHHRRQRRQPYHHGAEKNPPKIVYYYQVSVQLH